MRAAMMLAVVGAGLAMGLMDAECSHPDTGMPMPRTKAPAFKAKAVVDETFVDLKLDDYEGKWLVLFFFPFAWTFVCPTEIVSFSEAVEEFREINAEVAAMSTDSHHTLLAWLRTPREDGGVSNLNIPLVADTSKVISREYGVLVTDPDDDMYGAALRGLFIIDPKGVIRSVQVNDDEVGRNVQETLRILKGFQYAEAHQGEACPAGWNPGSDTIKADPTGSKEYFKKTFSKLAA